MPDRLHQHTAEQFWTVPNILSLYRILVFPFVLWLIINRKEMLFSIFITISLVSDILDGLIARMFDQKTRIGARLDSWADLGTYILAFLAIYRFKWDDISPHATMIYIFASVMVLSYAVVFFRFNCLIGLHTYMFKITGYMQGAFIVSLFLWGFHVWPYYVCLVWGTIACIEEILIMFVLKHPRSDVKGLYWVLKNYSA